MKKLFTPVLALTLLTATALVSCSKNDPEPQDNTVVAPDTSVTTLKTASVTAQGGTQSSGSLAIVRDETGKELVQLNEDFVTEFHTGSLGVYLAKSDGQVNAQQAAGAGNVLKVGTIVKNGKQFLEIPTKGAYTGFSHVVFYCEAARYNFAAAALK